MEIEHIALYVKDLEGARDFFSAYFGGAAGPLYHKPRTGFRTYFLAFDGGARLELMTRPELAEGGGAAIAPGYAYLAFRAGSRAKEDELTERLRRDGYPVVSGPRVTGDGYYESCVAGPEGAVLELTV